MRTIVLYTGIVWTLFIVGCAQPKRDRVIVVRTVGEPTGDDDDDVTGDDDDVTGDDDDATGDDDDDDVTGDDDDTTPPDPEGPVIESVWVIEGEATLQIQVVTDPGESTLEGGTLWVDIDDIEPYRLSIPDDLLSFEDNVLSFEVDRTRVGRCTEGTTHDLAVEVTDLDNRASGQFEQLIETTDIGIIVDEVGYFYASPVGTLTSPTTICGTLDSTGNDGDIEYTGDLDFVLFDIDTTGTWTMQLDWTVVGDWDLYLFEEQANGDLLDIDQSSGPALSGPEELTTSLNSLRTYAFEVAGWDGDAGDWTVVIE